MKNFLMLLSVMTIVLIHGCENGEAPLINPELFISPDTLIINSRDTVKVVFISAKPRLKCDFIITEKPEWLTITPQQGIIDGEMVPIYVRPKAGLAPGFYQGTISLISDNAGSIEARVIMSVSEHPKIKVYPSALSIPGNVKDTIINIQNTGTGNLIWDITSSPGWLNLSPSSGLLAANSSYSLTVSCNRAGLIPSEYSGQIIIGSNSEVSIEPVNVSITVPSFVEVQVPDSICFSELTEKLNIVITNTGNTQVSWNAIPGNFLTLSNTTGNIAMAASQVIEVALNRSSFQTGTYESSITINYGVGSTVTIPVRIKHLIQSKMALEGIVTDAEFCRQTNRVILVTTNPDRLSIIDPDTKTIESVELHSYPRCVAVNKAGDKAVTGHNGMITYIDLANKTIEKESTVSCDVLDLVLTSAGWVYAFPLRDQWTRIVCINPLTGAETLQTGNYIYAGTLGKLHPSEKWIYGADNGLSPSDIEKYNIENGTANLIYDSPYHGDYPMEGNLWFSEEGDRIFTRGRTVLRSSADKSSDMIYNGSVPGTNDIWALFHSGSAGKIFYITCTYDWQNVIPASEVSVCNYAYLSFLKSYPLEKFIVPDDISGTRLCNAEGHFVFANNAGTKIYVVIRAEGSSGLLNDWAIQSISAD